MSNLPIYHPHAHCALVEKCTAPAVAIQSGADIVVWCEAGHVSIISPNIPDIIRQVHDFSRSEKHWRKT